VFRRFRSAEPFPFRGEPLAGERRLARAAFLRGWSDPRALGALSELWVADAARSWVASRWLLDELEGDDVEGGAGDAALLGLGGGAGLRALAASEGECAPAPDYVTDPRSPPRRLVAASGTTLPPSRPEAALDDRATPEWAEGWRVRPAGAPPRLELELDRPRRLSSVRLVVRPIDGSLVRARLFAREPGGRWRPLAGGGGPRLVGCRDARVFGIAPTEGPVAALGVELQGEALSHRIALHEVWAVEQP
jgi:hypothetical protein